MPLPRSRSFGISIGASCGPAAELLAALLAVGCASSPVVTCSPGDEVEGVVYSLPRTLLELTVTVAEVTEQSGPSRWKVTLTVTPHTVADPTKQFVLQRNSNPLWDDDVKIAIDPGGLLTSVNTVTEDRSLGVVESLFKAGVAAFTLGATGGVGVPPMFVADAEQQARSLIDEEIRRRMQPLVGSHTRFYALPSSGPIRATLSAFPAPDWSLDLRLARIDEVRVEAPTASMARPTQPPSTPRDGILVRGIEPYVASAELVWRLRLPERAGSDPMFRAVAMQVRAEATEATQKDFAKEVGRAYRTTLAQMGFDTVDHMFEKAFTVRVEKDVLVPDYAPITSVSLARALFVKSTGDVTLTDGHVATQAWNRPSSLFAVANVPLDLAKSIVEVPAEILQLKFNVATHAANLLDAEAKITEKQRADEDAYYSAVALAHDAKTAWQAAINTPNEATARAAFVTAAITANAAARKIGRAPPYPEIEQP